MARAPVRPYGMLGMTTLLEPVPLAEHTITLPKVASRAHITCWEGKRPYLRASGKAESGFGAQQGYFETAADQSNVHTLVPNQCADCIP